MVLHGRRTYDRFGPARAVSPNLSPLPLYQVSICRTCNYVLTRQGYKRITSYLETSTGGSNLPFSAMGYPGAISMPHITPRYIGAKCELSAVLPFLPMFNLLGKINLGVRVNYCFFGVRLLAATQFSTILLLMRTGYKTIASVLPSGVLVLLPESIFGIDAGQYDRSVERSVFIESPGVRKMLLSGNRPKVRGTVKNPNDHPHGGRTRSIQYPVTP